MSPNKNPLYFYAINLGDLTRFIPPDAPFHPLRLLLNPIVTDTVVHCEGNKWDGDSILLKPDLPLQRWQAVFQLLRHGFGRFPPTHKHQLRIYRSRSGQGGWQRI